jgi:hypothetical protein
MKSWPWFTETLRKTLNGHRLYASSQSCNREKSTWESADTFEAITPFRAQQLEYLLDVRSGLGGLCHAVRGYYRCEP